MNITWVTWSYHVSCRRNSDVDRKKKKKEEERNWSNIRRRRRNWSNIRSCGCAGRITRQLQNIYACTGRPMYLWCWNEQACRSHICIVDAPHQREASGCHVCLGKAGPSYINTGPWPPYPCLWGRIIRLNICGANWLPWLLKKADPLNLNIGPWDTHPSKYGACLWRMDMCKWSIPITILNHSQMVASVAKKKQALYI